MSIKHNRQNRLQKMAQKNERFSIRKLSVGAASVLIGLSFLGFNAHTANAETTDGSHSDSDASQNTDVQSVDSQSKLNVTTASQVAAKENETTKPVSSTTDQNDNVITSNGNGTVTGKNSQGTWAAKDATTPEAPVHYNNSQNVSNWNGFINALSDANVDNINITQDINVTGGVGKQAKITQGILYPGRIYLEGTNIARKLDITGNGHTIDFGKYSLGFQDANQKNGSGWDLTFKDLTINAGSLKGSTAQTDYPSQSPINFYKVNADNQAKDTVTFENVNADVKDRPVINGHTMNRSGASYVQDEKYTLILKGNNNLKSTAWTGGVTPGDDGDAISAGYIVVEDGTTTVDIPQTNSYNLQYGGAAVRVAQDGDQDAYGNFTKYSLDVKDGATLNIKGGTNVKGIVAGNATKSGINIDGNVNMDMGSGHSIAMLAGNLNVGKTGNLDITTNQLQNTDKNILNFNSGQYGVLSIGVGYPANTTNQDRNVINDNGSIKIVRNSTGKTYGPLISMGSGSAAVLKGTFTINVSQDATLDLQDKATQTGLGMIYVSGSSANSNINIVNPKYLNLQRLNSPLPKNGSELIYLEGGGQSGRTNGLHITNTPIAEWQAANMSTAPNFLWTVQSVNSMNNWGDNAGSGFTVAGKPSPENKKGQDKFLYSNGYVLLASNQSGVNSFGYNGNQTVNPNSNQGIILKGSSIAGGANYYTPYLNQFLNNYNPWTSQRLAMGSSLINPNSPIVPKDSDLYEPEVQTINGTTKQTLNDLDPNKGIKDLKKAQIENGKWTSAIVPVDGIVKNVSWYSAADSRDWANIMAGQDTPVNPTGKLKTTDKSAWAKVTYEDGSIDFVNIPLNIIDLTDAEQNIASAKSAVVTHVGANVNTPSLNPSNVELTWKDENGNPISAPTNYKVSWVEAPSTSDITEETASLLITFADNSTEIVKVPVTVKGATAINGNKVNQGDPAPKARLAVNTRDVDNFGISAMTWAQEPDTNVAGAAVPGVVKVDYSDGTSQFVNTSIDVIGVEKGTDHKDDTSLYRVYGTSSTVHGTDGQSTNKGQVIYTRNRLTDYAYPVGDPKRVTYTKWQRID